MSLIGSKKKQKANENDVSIGKTPVLLATFTTPYSIKSIVLDPADRACYIGTAEGCFSLNLFYKLKGNAIVNLLQSAGVNTVQKGRVFSLVQRNSLTGGENEDLDALYAMGQLVCENVLNSNVTNLLTNPYRLERGNLLLEGESKGKQASNNNGHNFMKIPNLQRVIFDGKNKGHLHDIWYQIGEPEAETDPNLALPLNDFNAYLEQVKTQESIFSHIGKVSSNVKVIDNKIDATSSLDSNAAKDEEITELKTNIEALTHAYKELRDMHEKLYEEHQQMLDKQ